MAYDVKRDRLYVGSSESKVFWVYSATSHQLVRSITTYDPPSSLAIDQAAGKLYVLYASNVFTYRTSNLARENIPHLGMFSDSIAIDPKRQRLYVVVNHSTVREQNLLTGKSRALDLDGDAMSICVDPNTRTAYLADPDGNVIRRLPLK